MQHCFVCDTIFVSSIGFNLHPCFETAIQKANMQIPKSMEYEEHMEKEYTKWEDLPVEDVTVVKDIKGIKHDSGKPKLSMVPTALGRGAARALMFGANKYGRDNFKLGMDWTKPLDALMRHTAEFADKKDIDNESTLCHLDHMAANIAMLLYYYENKVGKDDR